MTGDRHVRFCESRGVRFPPGYSTYTPSAGFKDVAGNLVNPGPVTTASQRF
jgi:hypothetical protein